MDDMEDCYLVFLTGLGARVQDVLTTPVKAAGTRVIEYNVRKLLRAGLRKSLQELLKKLGGTWLARKLTERALMRLLVPGINIPVAAFANQWFTSRMLKTADRFMARRGQVIQPLVKMYKREGDLPRSFAVKALIAFVNNGDPELWSEEQMNALRICQSFLSLSDEDMAELDYCFELDLPAVLEESSLSSQGAADLAELLTVAAAFADGERFDGAYAQALSGLEPALGETRGQAVWQGQIAEARLRH
jgi:hypothetical protein